MNQKRISFLLIAAGIVAAFGILVLSLFYAPGLAEEALQAYQDVPGIRGLYRMGLSGVWVTAALFLLALADYFRISVRIGKNRSFCAENVKSLKRIAVYIAVCAVLWAGAVFAPGLFFHIPIGPAWVFFLLFSMANAALSMLALGLSLLLSRVVEMQQENDLTV